MKIAVEPAFNVKIALEALGFARRAIADLRYEYLCNALDGYAYIQQSREVDEVVHDLKVWISWQIRGQGTLYVYLKVCLGQTVERRDLRVMRLEWIDKMVDLLTKHQELNTHDLSPIDWVTAGRGYSNK